MVDGLILDWIVADEWYGEKPAFNAGLEELDQRFVLEIPKNRMGWLYEPPDADADRGEVQHLVRWSGPMLQQERTEFHIKDTNPSVATFGLALDVPLCPSDYSPPADSGGNSLVSHYQSPYQPPGLPPQPDFYYGAYADPRSPARRAAILMFILGSLGMLCGAFMLVAGSFITPDQVAASPQAQQLQELEAQVGGSFRVVAILMGLMMALPGLVFLGLGFWVRRGGAAGSVVAIVLTGLTLLLLLANVVASIVRGGDPSTVAVGLCAVIVPAALCVLLLVWLMQAVRAAPAVRALHQHYQAQYWQSQQLAQNYPAAGYGYGPQAPSAAPPAPPQMPYPTAPPPQSSQPAPPENPANGPQ